MAEKTLSKSMIFVVSLNDCMCMVMFKGAPVFELNASKEGIIASPVARDLDERSMAGYNWTYTGQVDVDFDKRALLSVDNVNEDPRGIICTVKFAGAEVYNIVGTHEGYARGGHSHPYAVNFSMPVGSGTWHILREGTWLEINQRPGSLLRIEEGEIHYVVAKSDMLLTESAVDCEKFQATNDPDCRTVVDDINKKERTPLKPG